MIAAVLNPYERLRFIDWDLPMLNLQTLDALPLIIDEGPLLPEPVGVRTLVLCAKSVRITVTIECTEHLPAHVERINHDWIVYVLNHATVESVLYQIEDYLVECMCLLFGWTYKTDASPQEQLQ